MKNIGKSFLSRLLKDQSGQVLPWMALLTVLFLGMAGLTIDLGRAWVCYRELQASTDAAALAGAYAMTSSSATNATVNSQVCAYGSNTDTSKTSLCGSVKGANGTPNLPTVTTSWTPNCVLGKYYVSTVCTATTLNANVIRVTQTATIPTYFIQALGAFGFKSLKTLTLNTMSSATLSGVTRPVNVAVVLDTTGSMGSNDGACGTREQCALAGVETMLKQLPPCAQIDPATGNCTAYNLVSLFTYPNIEANTAANDYTCKKGNPTVMPYTAPTAPTSSTTSWTPPSGTAATYQITGYGHDYNTGTTTGQNASLNGSSDIVVATGGGSCGGLQTPGGAGTYYAGAINAAATSLLAQSSSNSTSQNVMIILSDGDANSTDFAKGAPKSGYGSDVSECQQAISAAANASSLGITVYTIAYGAPSSGCSTDAKGTSPCATMQQMSTGWSDPKVKQKNFYSDQSGNSGQCPGGGPTDLPSIFGSITASFSQARLVPNS